MPAGPQLPAAVSRRNRTRLTWWAVALPTAAFAVFLLLLTFLLTASPASADGPSDAGASGGGAVAQVMRFAWFAMEYLAP
ncbi:MULTISPECIES: hypothetical protein [Streptomyces]|uniref:Uncharacterized protein n=3 Tax=Streptomyces TaxID=1883 RepID=A0A3Q9FUK7_STRLT|nr:hypothetical protein [Streptomyces luteoverticillatus]AZQ71002.1 hypothetical protein EKH77_07075 [Streptomyces luteoverticillatus]